MITKMFRVNINYMFIAQDTILERDSDGNYHALFSLRDQAKSGILKGFVLEGKIVENTPDVFEEVTHLF